MRKNEMKILLIKRKWNKFICFKDLSHKLHTMFDHRPHGNKPENR